MNNTNEKHADRTNILYYKICAGALLRRGQKSLRVIYTSVINSDASLCSVSIHTRIKCRYTNPLDRARSGRGDIRRPDRGTASEYEITRGRRTIIIIIIII